MYIIRCIYIIYVGRLCIYIYTNVKRILAGGSHSGKRWDLKPSQRLNGLVVYILSLFGLSYHPFNPITSFTHKGDVCNKYNVYINMRIKILIHSCTTNYRYSKSCNNPNIFENRIHKRVNWLMTFMLMIFTFQEFLTTIIFP